VRRAAAQDAGSPAAFETNGGETHFSDLQTQIYLEGMQGRTPALPISVEDLETAAKKVMSPQSYNFVAGGAGAEKTMQANLEAFDKWAIVPRMMRDVSQRNYRVRLFNTDLRAPIALAPVGQQGAVHANAEAATGRAAASLGLPMILSTVASRSMETVAEAMGNAPRWFQLYWPNDSQLTKSFLKRAEAAGYTALFVTLDTPLQGWRERDLNSAYLPFISGEGLANYFSDPHFRSRLASSPEQDPQAAVMEFAKVFRHLDWTWKDITFLRDNTSLPIVLKGILHPDDARKAVEVGVDGIVVSNHGGRQVDGAIASLDALSMVVKAVGGAIPILFDSGIRRGADIVKALALGAKAVLIGRPFVWGLAVDGENGVRTVLQRLLADFDLTMSLSGYTHQNQLRAAALCSQK
jgi:isopentenyl diphosphate isomerase/L-lactate dehydrogenase-like FMN-dependent dehydrogenase